MSALDRKAIATAIFDPGATEGYKGERTLTEWQTDAVMRVLAASPKGQVEAVAQWQVWVEPGEDEATVTGWVSEDADMIDHWRSRGRKVRPLYTHPAPEERTQIAERLITEYHEHCMAAGKSSIEYPAGLQHQASAFLAGRHDLLAPAQVEPKDAAHLET